MPFSPWVATPSRPDTFSAESLLSHARFRGKDGRLAGGEDLAVAIWRYMVDKDCGFYHFWSPVEKPLGEDVRRYVKDALKLVNCYGAFLCGTAAAVEVWLWENAGLRARVVGLSGHVVAECFYDGRWHLLDADLQAFHRLHPPEEDTIASVAECMEDTTLVSRQENPSQPFYVSDRAPEKMAQSCYAPGKATYYPSYMPELHSMDYFLRPGEEMVRFYEPKGRWFCPPEWVENSEKFKSEWTAEGPRERHPPHRRYANGYFRYRPALSSADIEAGVLEMEGFDTTEDGLRVASGTARAVIPVLSPYVMAGRRPDWKKAHESEDGALLSLEAAGTGLVKVSLSVDDAATWREVVSVSVEDDTGVVRADFTPFIENRYRYLLRLEAEGCLTLKSLDLTTWFQVNPGTLPLLVEGSNKVELSVAGNARVPFTLDLTPHLDEYLLSCTGRRLEETDKSIEGPFEAVLRLVSPWGGSISGVYFFGSFHEAREAPEGSRTEEVVFSVSSDAGGPWKDFFRCAVPVKAPEQGTWPWGRGEFVQFDEPLEEIFIRVRSPVDAWEFEARLEAGDVLSLPEGPVEVELHYNEEGRGITAAHRLAPPECGSVFQVDCAGPVEMERVVLRVPSSGGV